MYNYFRQGWLVGRIAKMAREVFGAEPLVISLPSTDRIDLNRPWNAFTMILVGDQEDNATIRAIRGSFDAGKAFWVNRAPRVNVAVHGYGTEPPRTADPVTSEWLNIHPAIVTPDAMTFVPTDRWPFLYLRERAVPLRPTVEGIVVVALLSLAFLAWCTPNRSLRPNWHMFFLGAGFMLLETKGVVEMALLFGSTWIVNSIVFVAILMMILCANLFVLLVKPSRLAPYYGLLLISLAVNQLVPIAWFLSLPGSIRLLASCVMVFAPIFFSGVIFATSFQNSLDPDVDIGSNIAGAIVGGLCENLSLVVGFPGLVLVGMGFYLLSAVWRLDPSRALVCQPNP